MDGISDERADSVQTASREARKSTCFDLGRPEPPQSLLPFRPESSMKFLFVIETLPTKKRKLTYLAPALALSDAFGLSPQHLICH